MLLIDCFAVLSLAASAVAAPATNTHVLHEKRDAPLRGWVKRSRVEKDTFMPMKIGLSQSNLDKGHDWLVEVSDPDSPSYGKYWSAEKVHEAFGASQEAESVVKAWLTSSGIHESRIKHYENKGWLAFDATAEEVEELLNAEFYEHEHVTSDKVRLGCDGYHVPRHVSQHVDFITPGIKLAPVVKRTVETKRKTKRNSAGQPPHSPWKMPMPWESWENPHYKPEPALSLPADVQGCGLNITPPCIKALYHIPNATLKSPGNSLGLFEQGDYFSKADIDLFLAEYAPYVPEGTYPIPALIDGAQFGMPQDSDENTGESDIDIDMATSLIYPQTVTLYQTDDQIYEPEEVAKFNVFNTFLDALDGSYCNYTAYGETGDDPSIDAVYPDPAAGGYKGQLQCGVYKPTNVISASYGQAEDDLPINYNLRQCNEFMKLALQGHSILVASGDYGVGSFPADLGVENGGTGCLGPTGEIFNPQYPSGCPYVLSVGATMLYADQTVLDPESVMHVNLSGTAQNFSSSGGFSNYYPQSSWQKGAVERYLDDYVPDYPSYAGINVDLNTTTGIYNRIGRGYPDVSANGVNYRAFTGGVDYHFYGSSLASPLFASVLTLINEERYQHGKGPVGFVAPTLYANPWVLNDVTNGTNVGCGTDGFPASPGWDPATGLGTPNYPKMLELFLSLP